MLIVRAIDGAIFRGRTARKIVQQMKRSNWSAPSRKVEYMQEVAERVFAGRGVPVRTDPVSFLHDLAEAGMLTIHVQVELDPDEAHDLMDCPTMRRNTRLGLEESLREIAYEDPDSPD